MTPCLSIYSTLPPPPLHLTPRVPLTRFLVPRFTLSRASYVIPHPLLCSIPCLSRDSVLHILRDPLPLAVTDISCRVGLSLLRSRFLECHATWGTLCDIPKNSCAGHSAVLALATTFNTMLYLPDWNNLKTKKKLYKETLISNLYTWERLFTDAVQSW